MTGSEYRLNRMIQCCGFTVMDASDGEHIEDLIGDEIDKATWRKVLRHLPDVLEAHSNLDVIHPYTDLSFRDVLCRCIERWCDNQPKVHKALCDDRESAHTEVCFLGDWK